MSGVERLVKDPITRILLEHEDRIQRLELLYRIGVAVAGAGLTLLGSILAVLLLKG